MAKYKRGRLPGKGEELTGERHMRARRQSEAAPSVQKMTAPHSGQTMPDHVTSRPLRQAHILQMQQQYGNGHVQRYLAGQDKGSPQRLQRKPGEETETPAKEGGGEKKEAFDLGKWLHVQIYETLAAELGEDKLKSHATTLAKKAADFLITQVKDAESEADFLRKAQLDDLGKSLAADLSKAVKEILASPEGAKAKETILKKIKMDPGAALGMVLLGLAAAVASNMEIPELSKKVELGAGFDVAGKAKLGKFRDLSLKQLQLGLGYTSKYFQAGITGTYSGEGEQEGFGGKAEASVGDKEVKFKADATIDPAGDLKLNAGPVIDLKQFGFTGTAGWHSTKGWMGVGELRLGGKKHYLAPKIVVDAEGKVTMALGYQLTRDMITFSSTFTGSQTQISGRHALNLKDPFGAAGLNVSASLHYVLDDPKITGANLAAQYKILGNDKAGPAPFLLLSVEGGYKPAGKDSPQTDLSGFVLLKGAFF